MGINQKQISLIEGRLGIGKAPSKKIRKMLRKS